MKRTSCQRNARHLLLSVLTFASFIAFAAGAEPDAKANIAGNKSDELFRRVEALDRAVFDAFNRCELEKLQSFFAPNLEFYHDKAGVTWTRDEFMQSVKKNACGKFRRELVTETLEVWPLADYGAVYSGTHRFCQFASGKCEGIGRFMHIWSNTAGEWKITRVISYDHKTAP